ncbi:MAG TPA: cytochrome c [Flavobacteriales bacterium]|jgi:mono/diheme cytochrome c family protein|nr:cytochrome c [Flavobacteriales bacterium]HOZ41002.1 cytochrome c [Flavobacteriales bacterium]
MRDELNLIELADRYLRGEMNATDSAAFEVRMRTNAELRELAEDQRALLGGIKRLALRPAVNKAYRSYKFGKWLPRIGGAVVIAVLAVGAWMLVKESGHSAEAASDASGQVEQLLALSDTTGTGLPALVMMIDPKKDTTMITPNGLVVDIPKGAFIDEAGKAITKPVRVTMLEAIDGVDIMKAGLITMSGDTLLETGGMFYIDAQVDGKRVSIDPTKPLTVMVPSEQADPRMMLYEGVMTEEGVVDWRNPKPLSHTLIPVDITTLDFYPPGYLAKVAELEKDATDKRYTDSLYWSFSGEYARYAFQGEAAPADSSWTDSLTDKAFARSADANSHGHMKGAFLFATNCSSCHRPERDLTGPALNGARQRWEGRGDIYAWIKNSSAYLKTGNHYANELFRKWNKSVMTPHDLSDAEIDQILRYVDMASSPSSGLMGIDPAKVQAIWNERFNGTNIATREFEERMHEVHRTCDNQVLELYANNLDKDLSQLDSMVVHMGHGAFASFALRNDGRVDLPAHAAERLRNVYAEWSQRYAEVARRTQEEFDQKEAQADQQAFQRQIDRQVKDSQQDSERFNKEFNANLRSVYQQLGYPMTPPAPPRSAFAVPITNPGWWNVDKAVLAATTSRSSMSYTDDRSGKTATLTYTPVTIEMADKDSFSELRVYLIPQELNSYQRVMETNGVFTEKLNALFQYDLVCMGWKEGQLYAASRQDISATGSITLSMEPTDEESLRRMVRTPQMTASLVSDLVEQSRHLEWLELEAKRQQAKAKREEFRSALMAVVFPCWGEGVPAAEESPYPSH